jgi:multidrug transporter EmrE-like cation transporter
MLALIVGSILALTDASMMSIMKNISMGILPYSYLTIVCIVYSLQPLLFMFGLNNTSMTVLNLSWDLMSDILVTMVGLFYFREHLSNKKAIGVLFAVLAIVLFSIDGE